jgi:hypothetical protein
MAKKNIQDYYCTVVSEKVQVILKNKINIGIKYKKEYFVKCNQEDCQYVDKNASPCPLGIEMFNLLSSV